MVKDNPFYLPPQSVISFSGGRTSGYMLKRNLDAFGGTLPDDRKVIFCNTGKEREETLTFVERCSQRWGVPIVWLEYRFTDGKHDFIQVDFASASRNGEPFRQAILARNFLPNPIARFCTVELKMLTMNRYVRYRLGWDKYTNAVGLRADESRRVRKATQVRDVQPSFFGDATRRKIKSGRPTGETAVFPLFSAGVTLDAVTAFWRANDFDLHLSQDEGNCDLCFLKGAAKLVKIIRERPHLADWWAETETLIESKTGNGLFRSDRPGYAELKLIATEKQAGPGWLWADDANGSCGEIEECRCTD